jgi:hypothetical protein
MTKILNADRELREDTFPHITLLDKGKFSNMYNLKLKVKSIFFIFCHHYWYSLFAKNGKEISYKILRSVILVPGISYFYPVTYKTTLVRIFIRKLSSIMALRLCDT